MVKARQALPGTTNTATGPEIDPEIGLDTTATGIATKTSTAIVNVIEFVTARPRPEGRGNAVGRSHHLGPGMTDIAAAPLLGMIWVGTEILTEQRTPMTGSGIVTLIEAIIETLATERIPSVTVLGGSRRVLHVSGTREILMTSAVIEAGRDTEGTLVIVRGEIRSVQGPATAIVITARIVIDVGSIATAVLRVITIMARTRPELLPTTAIMIDEGADPQSSVTCEIT